MILDNTCYIIDDFLPKEEIENLFKLIEANVENFAPTTTATNAENYRKSRVLGGHYYPELLEEWKRKIYNLLPKVCLELLFPYFEPVDFEMQLTGSNDGDFYKTHNDNGHEIVAKREVTYVYYFHSEPKQFSGGALQLYPTETTSWELVLPDEGSLYVEPKHNRIVFFDSRLMHQVLPVKCESKNFLHSRFTINGWIKS